MDGVERGGPNGGNVYPLRPRTADSTGDGHPTIPEAREATIFQFPDPRHGALEQEIRNIRGMFKIGHEIQLELRPAIEPGLPDDCTIICRSLTALKQFDMQDLAKNLKPPVDKRSSLYIDFFGSPPLEQHEARKEIFQIAQKLSLATGQSVYLVSFPGVTFKGKDVDIEYVYSLDKHFNLIRNHAIGENDLPKIPRQRNSQACTSMEIIETKNIAFLNCRREAVPLKYFNNKETLIILDESAYHMPANEIAKIGRSLFCYSPGSKLRLLIVCKGDTYAHIDLNSKAREINDALREMEASNS